MPTPVSAARQCLAGEAAVALDGAVAIARRRAHSQTTSLHVVSALLSLPSSSPSLLRDALARARSAVYPSRLQSKALEICFSAALDRLPAAASGSGGGSSQQLPAEPPVSNSLMAAIKRSQANQRRNPDAFHLYQHQYPQQQQLNSPSVGPKVELQQLVLSILDDPIVSRVFGEAGFRSYDVKLAILRPPPSVLRYPRAGGRCPPLFLCNFSLGADDFDLASRGFPFPLSPQPLHSDAADENCRRIADVLKRGRNVLLVGVGGYDAARDLERAIATQNWAFFPPNFCRLRFLSLEKEVVEFVGGGRDRPWVDSKFRDLGLQLAAEEFLSSQGAVLCFGDLKRLVDMVGEEEEGDGLGRVSYVVSELTRVVDGHPGRLWLMGWAATYETYMKFLSLCPSADKDWSLQLLPITSLKSASGSGDVFSGPRSSMESFVPFGGFPPVSTDSVPPVSRQCNSSGPCQLCSDKYEQELADLLKELSAPAGVEFQLNPHPFQQQTELITIHSGVDVEKAKDDGTTLNTKIIDLKKKWKDICQHQHQGSQILERVASKSFSLVNGVHLDADKEESGDQADGNVGGSQGQDIDRKIFPEVVDLPSISSASQRIRLPMIPEVNESFLSKLKGRPLNNEQLLTSGSQSHSGCLSLMSAPDELTSPSSVTSVSTDLMLGNVHTSMKKAEKSTLCLHLGNSHELHRCLGSKGIDVASGNVSAVLTQCSSCVTYSDSPGTKCLSVQAASYPKGCGASASAQPNLCSANVSRPSDIQDLKAFCMSLKEKVGWQEDAIHAIGKSIIQCKADGRRLLGSRSRGDIWLSFLGPDRVGKRKIAMALAELLFGSKQRFICVDVNSQYDELILHPKTVCSKEEINGYELSLRGKTVVDHIAAEICKKPWSVVFLENVDKADLLVQASLSQAIKTGRFSDSHRREIAVNNAVFVTTAEKVTNEPCIPTKPLMKYAEERILAARPWEMKVVVVSGASSLDGELCVQISGASWKETKNDSVPHARKRKQNMVDAGDEQRPSAATAKGTNKSSNTCLDLNLPVEELGADDTGDNSDGNSHVPDDMSAAWMEEFLNSADETIVFKPFDFDALASGIQTEISESFRSSVGANYVLDIDPKVMEQVLAAAWLSEGKNAISNWIQQVLVKSFIEAQKVHHPPPHSIFRLVACDGASVKNYTPGIHLPLRIILD